MQKPFLLFDWDGVIQDVKRNINAIFSVFKKWGVYDQAVLDQSYKDAKGGGHGYKPESQLELLGEYIGAGNMDKARAELNSIFLDTSDRVFSDARNFLTAADQQGYAMGILSAGDREYQQRKIATSGLKFPWKEVLIVEGMDPERQKANLVAGLLDQYPTLAFFDDRVGMISAVGEKTKYTPSLRLYWVRRHQEVPAPRNAQVIDEFTPDLFSNLV